MLRERKTNNSPTRTTLSTNAWKLLPLPLNAARNSHLACIGLPFFLVFDDVESGKSFRKSTIPPPHEQGQSIEWLREVVGRGAAIGRHLWFAVLLPEPRPFIASGAAHGFCEQRSPTDACISLYRCLFSTPRPNSGMIPSRARVTALSSSKLSRTELLATLCRKARSQPKPERFP